MLLKEQHLLFELRQIILNLFKELEGHFILIIFQGTLSFF